MKEFKDILAHWKGERGLVETGQLLGVSAATVHYWLLGDRLPPLTRLPVLAEAFGMPLDALRDLITAERAARPSGPAEATTVILAKAKPAPLASQLTKVEVLALQQTIAFLNTCSVNTTLTQVERSVAADELVKATAWLTGGIAGELSDVDLALVRARLADDVALTTPGLRSL